MSSSEKDNINRPLKMPLTYHDTEFMNSDAARELRILSEYLYPEHQFTKKKISKAIIIYDPLVFYLWMYGLKSMKN